MIRVGTSGWQYRDWRSRFYPEGLPQRRWLEHYATRFTTVEVNASFYHLPTADTFSHWREATPPGFVVAPKMSRFVTHIRRLRDCEEPVATFLERARHLRGKLGPVLVQLPPTLRADAPLLEDFVSLLPRETRWAIEFRHASWLSDEVLRILDERGVAFVLADRPGARVPDVVTGGWSYLRFHQGTREGPGYRREKLVRWADRVMRFPPGDVFAYFNNDTGAAAPRDAEILSGILVERGGDVAEPDGLA